MGTRSLRGSSWRKAAMAALGTTGALALGAILAAPALAAPTVQASIDGTGSATVMTTAEGDAYLSIAIGAAGYYDIASTASQGADGDTIATLYDSSMNELDANDDRNADTNFAISRELDAGTYYLKVGGKELQQDASITVSVQQGRALSTLDCRYTFGDDGSVSSFTLGSYAHGEKSTWSAADAGSYSIVGYADREVFLHAQEDGAVDKLVWSVGTGGLPQGTGRYVVKVQAAGANGAYVGDAYYALDNVDPSSISELDPQVTKAICGAVEKVELGVYTIVPTNWSERWDAITASYYQVDGYCARDDFEEKGGVDSAVTWAKGLPNVTGRYVVKLSATNADENPYTGSCYVWAEVGETSHVASRWVVDQRPTFSKEGTRHMVCTYCDALFGETSIPALSGTTESAGSGVSAADYKFLTSKAVSYVASNSSKATATVPASVKFNGVSYKVTGIGAKAFAKAKKVKTVTVKSTALTKASVKNALKGSKVTTVKVPKSKKKAYAQLFTKKVCGKKVTVK